MLTCKQMTELITDYLEGALPLWQRVSFQMHLGMCRSCRAYLKQMRATIQLTGRLPEEPIPDEIAKELARRFRSWKQRS